MSRKVFTRLLAAFGLASTPAIAAAPASVDAIKFVGIDGQDLPLSSFAGQVVLVVNTASKCGFTKQYDGLQTLWETYKDQGLVVLGVPSNDFGNQEPGTNAEIKTFCTVNFNVTFPMTQKVSVKGADAHPFYQWSKAQLGRDGVPGWNFHKILIGRDGQALDGFGSMTKPNAKRLRQAIEAALAQSAP